MMLADVTRITPQVECTECSGRALIYVPRTRAVSGSGVVREPSGYRGRDHLGEQLVGISIDHKTQGSQRTVADCWQLGVLRTAVVCPVAVPLRVIP
jgi:hypothetical protein